MKKFNPPIIRNQKAWVLLENNTNEDVIYNLFGENQNNTIVNENNSVIDNDLKAKQLYDYDNNSAGKVTFLSEDVFFQSCNNSSLYGATWVRTKAEFGQQISNVDIIRYNDSLSNPLHNYTTRDHKYFPELGLVVGYGDDLIIIDASNGDLLFGEKALTSTYNFTDVVYNPATNEFCLLKKENYSVELLNASSFNYSPVPILLPLNLYEKLEIDTVNNILYVLRVHTLSNLEETHVLRIVLDGIYGNQAIIPLDFFYSPPRVYSCDYFELHNEKIYIGGVGRWSGISNYLSSTPIGTELQTTFIIDTNTQTVTNLFFISSKIAVLSNGNVAISKMETLEIVVLDKNTNAVVKTIDESILKFDESKPIWEFVINDMSYSSANKVLLVSVGTYGTPPQAITNRQFLFDDNLNLLWEGTVNELIGGMELISYSGAVGITDGGTIYNLIFTLPFIDSFFAYRQNFTITQGINLKITTSADVLVTQINNGSNLGEQLMKKDFETSPIKIKCLKAQGFDQAQLSNPLQYNQKTNTGAIDSNLIYLNTKDSALNSKFIVYLNEIEHDFTNFIIDSRGFITVKINANSKLWLSFTYDQVDVFGTKK